MCDINVAPNLCTAILKLVAVVVVAELTDLHAVLYVNYVLFLVEKGNSM